MQFSYVNTCISVRLLRNFKYQDRVVNEQRNCQFVVIDKLCTTANFVCTRKDSKKPYSCPAGGSSGLGCWGYIEAFREMIEQVHTYE